MADIDTGDSGGKGGKGKPKKIHLRVDFTPMVDMNMLLITFFMFCTTLSKPQIMNLVVPSKDDKEILKDDQPKTADSRTTTVILAGDDVIYYYFGKPNYDDPSTVFKTDYSPQGLRDVLVQKNSATIRQVAELRLQKQRGEISEEAFQEQVNEFKKDKEAQVVIIKPTDASTYENLVSVLDEMQICSIGVYAIVEPADGDLFMVEQYLNAASAQGGAVAANVR